MPGINPRKPLLQNPTTAVAIWLLAVAFLVFLMILVGGATRLTDSGLSITEWKPILGAIPPLSETDWHLAFEKYKQIPEYELSTKTSHLKASKRSSGGNGAIVF